MRSMFSSVNVNKEHLVRNEWSEAFSVSEVFYLMRSQVLSERQGKLILTEIERKPWWWALMTMFL